MGRFVHDMNDMKSVEKACPRCGLIMAITTEESPDSKEAHYTCPQHGRQIMISMNLVGRKSAREPRTKTEEGADSQPLVRTKEL